MPRPRKPTRLHLVADTFRQDRHGGNEPVPPRTLGEPPRYLNEAQREIWREIAAEAAAGLFTGMDRHALAQYCVTLSASIKCAELLNATGSPIIRSNDHKTPRPVAHPALKLFLRLQDALHRRENDFGFTPAARARIRLPDGPPADDPVARFEK